MCTRVEVPAIVCLMKAHKMLHSSTVCSWMASSPLFQLVFRPSLKAFDLLIHLRSKFLPRRHLAVDPTSAPSTSTLPALPNPSHMPVVDFDPATVYLSELEVCMHVCVRMCNSVLPHFGLILQWISVGVIF